MTRQQTLLERQIAFMRAIHDEDAPLPEGWGNRQALGMSVYRGNYRSALLGALENTFERTARYVGEEPFKRACAHHAIAHPPAGWTIDEVGQGFDATCAELFANNPEVADLAWLEWTMLAVSRARDFDPISADEFAVRTAGFGDEDWMVMRLELQPRAEAKVVETNLAALWKTLEDGADSQLPAARLDTPRGVIVSREGERPVFQMVDPDVALAFEAVKRGAGYGEAIMLLAGEDPEAEAIQQAALRAGTMLGDWLKEGLITALDR